MLGDKAVTIKALRYRGGLIEWCYDSHQQARHLWTELRKTGRAPDTGDELVSACYFLGSKIEPHKTWEKASDEAGPVAVGDFVTWRDAKTPNALALANCKVLKLGYKDEHGQPAALISFCGQEAGALIADLHHE